MALPLRTDVEPEVGAGLTIRDVSDLLSVPAPTIRSWERRYGVPCTPRSTGGHRRYSPAEVVTLRRMRDEIARGRRAADAAVRVRDAGEPGEPQRSFIAEFIDAALRLDASAAVATLDRAGASLGVEDAVVGVLLPAMGEVGPWWQAGRCDLGAERQATDSARAWLHGLVRRAPAPWQPEGVILTCGPRDQHTVGQEALAVLLARRGFACRLLGTRTPPAAVQTAVRATGAGAVVVVSHLSVARRAAVESLRGVETSDAALFYAGSSFIPPAARAGVPGTYLGEDLALAADTISGALLGRRPPTDLTSRRRAARS